MLCRDKDCIDPYGLIVKVLDCYLALTVRTKEAVLICLTYFRKLIGKLMCKRDRKGHKFLSIVVSITEHHTLISGTCIVVSLITVAALKRSIDTHSDIS